MANTRNKTPASGSRKRSKTMLAETINLETLGETEGQESSNHSSDDVISDGGDSAVQVLKKPWLSFNFLSKELESRYLQYNISHRNIVFGKSVSGSEFEACGLVKIFQSVGMLPLIYLPDACYPNLVQEFYANLYVDKEGDFISRVRDQGICLNSAVLNGMLIFKGLYGDDLKVPVTKKGICLLFEDLSELDQHCLVRGDENNVDVTLPTTAVLDPMANLLFKICRTNICPRVRNRSVMTCQDLIVVSLLLKQKKFDVSGLILHNMLNCVKKRKSAMPYALLLTTVFKYSGVKLDDKDKVLVTKMYHSVSLTRSILRVNALGELEKIHVPQPPPETFSHPESSVEDSSLLSVLYDLRNMCLGLRSGLDGSLKEIKELKVVNNDIKQMHEALLTKVLRVRVINDVAGLIGPSRVYSTATEDRFSPVGSVPKSSKDDDAEVDHLFGD